MDKQKIDLFFAMNSKFFPPEKLPLMRDQLESLTESQWLAVQSTSYNDPTILLIVSIFLGGLGIDRFMIGDTGLGIGKLLTCGGMGVWSIIDLFLIMGATRESNFKKLMTTVAIMK